MGGGAPPRSTPPPPRSTPPPPASLHTRCSSPAPALHSTPSAVPIKARARACNATPQRRATCRVGGGAAGPLAGASLAHLRVYNYALPREDMDTDAACPNDPSACGTLLLRGYGRAEADDVAPGSIARQGAGILAASTPLYFNGSTHYLLVRRDRASPACQAWRHGCSCSAGSVQPWSSMTDERCCAGCWDCRCWLGHAASWCMLAVLTAAAAADAPGWHGCRWASGAPALLAAAAAGPCVMSSAWRWLPSRCPRLLLMRLRHASMFSHVHGPCTRCCCQVCCPFLLPTAAPR